MEQMGLALEEYLLCPKEFSYGSEPFRYSFDTLNVDVFYLAAVSDSVTIEIEDNLPYFVSGDNVGGFIVTVWKTG